MEQQHQLITGARKFLKTRDAAAYNFPGMGEGKKGCLAIRCTPALLDRALAFMEELFQLLRTRNYEIQIKNDETYAQVKGYAIKIACHEKAKRVIVKGGKWDRSELHPTGLLSFKAGNFTKQEWQDNAKDHSRRLENYLPAIIAWLEKEADYWNEIKEGHRRDETLRKLQAEREKEAEAIHLAEVAAFDKLMSDAERFHKARLIREYIYEAEVREADPVWLDWARKKADWYDPFVGQPDELLGEYEPVAHK